LDPKLLRSLRRMANAGGKETLGGTGFCWQSAYDLVEPTPIVHLS
jgi:hypothetical protein